MHCRRYKYNGANTIVDIVDIIDMQTATTQLFVSFSHVCSACRPRSGEASTRSTQLLCHIYIECVQWNASERVRSRARFSVCLLAVDKIAKCNNNNNNKKLNWRRTKCFVVSLCWTHINYSHIYIQARHTPYATSHALHTDRTDCTEM